MRALAAISSWSTSLNEPIEFPRLIKPDGNNPLSQAIVYLSGKPFKATETQTNPRGRNYLPVFFSREI